MKCVNTIEQFIQLLTYIFLGALQGFTEPLPISSSGHLIIFRELFHIEATGLSFEIIVHFGSLLAVIALYRKEITTLLRESFVFMTTRHEQYKKSFQYVFYLLLATFMTGSIGLLIEPFISTQLVNIRYIGYSLIVTGIFLWIIRRLHGYKTDTTITWKEACIIGLLQTLALIPGISRSGVTIVVAMLLGFKRETAIRFSFLLYIPVTFGIQLLSLQTIIQDTLFHKNFILYTVAFLTAIITTYVALKWFISVMLHGRLIIFTLYCCALGLLLILVT